MMRAPIAPDSLFLSLTGALSMLASLAACAGSATGRGQDSSLGFICDGGTFFRVDVRDRQIRVTTRTGVYDLDARPSSIGRKYSSADTTFILDEERAVLVGAGGGPFKHCHAV
jgi:hypothetical protein